MLKRLIAELLAAKNVADATTVATVNAANGQADAPLVKHGYDADGFTSTHNHEFMHEPAFAEAYARGVAAVGYDYNWHWRVHVGLWAARCAVRLQGDFVECGVNYGFLSSAIMHALDWNSLDRTFYLLDTFAGTDESLLTDGERRDGALVRNREQLRNGFYVSGAERARQNFAEWKNVRIIEGAIPGTLNQVHADRVAFLHLDMNAAEPEIAAAQYLWDRLVSGAMVLLDDYAYLGYHHQKEAMDRFARDRNIPIVSLPTGQGLFVVA